jgi:hypothetical protein
MFANGRLCEAEKRVMWGLAWVRETNDRFGFSAFLRIRYLALEKSDL